MRSAINGLAALATILALIVTLNLYLGFAGGTYGTGTGPASGPQQLIALISAAMAIGLGFAGRILDRRMPRPASKLSNYSIALGALAGLLVLAIPFVFS